MKQYKMHNTTNTTMNNESTYNIQKQALRARYLSGSGENTHSNNKR